MSYRLLRAYALASLIILAGLSGAACNSRNEGGAANGGAGTNAGRPANSTQPADGAGRAESASKAGGGDAAAPAGAQQVEMADDVFRPALLTVPVGTKVTWVNKGHKAHTVVSNDKLFDSGLVDVDEQFSYTFSAPGTYSYHCAPHAKMVGQVVVK